jgi:DNA-binding NarL/FixJ family response regulator/class 3 adenylate cyclase
VTDLPTGELTFLFTDMEGSTKLLNALGDDYAALLSDTRRLIREAVAAVGGHVVDCRGDEFFVVFEDARSAASAALAAQRALKTHSWPVGATVRVRMGLHTGRAAREDDDYVGIDVHRAARISSSAHGGQILVSVATSKLLPEHEVADVGLFELSGLPEPERLLQLLDDGAASAFPPPRFARPRPESTVQVVIADDSVLLREGIARLLEDAGIEVAGQSGTAEDLLRHVPLYKPDVAIVDIRMPPTHSDEGLRAAQTIRERYPEVGVLVLSQYAEPAYALELLSEDVEGVGYLLKDRVSDVDEFVAAVRRVAQRGSALDPTVVQMLVGRRGEADPLEELTPREREVLELMAEGKSNQAIAERLVVTLRAVEKHVTSIFSKLRLPASGDDHRRVLAVLTYLRS